MGAHIINIKLSEKNECIHKNWYHRRTSNDSNDNICENNNKLSVWCCTLYHSRSYDMMWNEMIWYDIVYCLIESEKSDDFHEGKSFQDYWSIIKGHNNGLLPSLLSTSIYLFIIQSETKILQFLCGTMKYVVYVLLTHTKL